MIKQEIHQIRGMQRDLTVAKFSPEFAFDAMNIRITARENDTLLAVTNEKGTLNIPLLSNGEPAEILGVTLGYCVIKNYITVFTKGDVDRIYRINRDGDIFNIVTLFEGDLNFNTDYPIQTLGSYENDNIQKVYWVDGINQPRMVNIVADQGEYNSPDKFNFIRDVSVNYTVNVEKDPNGSGSFHSGVIQYALSYYVKYAQESAVFYASPLLYISPENRGGSPDEICNCNFKVTINDADINFDGVNIYSIQRTSLDATPTVKLITSLPIVKGQELILGVPYIGTGSVTGVTEEGLQVYRNNTLTPLSNYPFTTDSEGNKVWSFTFNTGTDGIFNATSGVNMYNASSMTVRIGPTKNEITFPTNTYTDWSCRLSTSKTISFVDNGSVGTTIDPTELLYKGGEEVIPYTITQKDNTLFLGNLTLKRRSIPEDIRAEIKNLNVGSGSKNSVYVNNSNNAIYPYKGYLNLDSQQATSFKTGETYRLGLIAMHKTGKWSEALPISDEVMTSRVINSFEQWYQLTQFSSLLPASLCQELLDLDYIAVKPVVVFPSYSDRTVLCQGIACPTNYIGDDRKNNSPYAQSSWFARPKLYVDKSVYDVQETTVQGTIPKSGHGDVVGSKTPQSNKYSIEVQSAVRVFVDENIFTFHSPDIEFDEALRPLLSNAKMRVVGLAKTISNAIDYSIVGGNYFRTSHTTNYPYSVVEYDYSKLYNIYNPLGYRRLVAAPLWRDGVIAVNNNPESDEVVTDDRGRLYSAHMTFPWHRDTSLNNDFRGYDGTAILRKKVMSTMLYTSTEYLGYTRYYNFEEDNDTYRTGISGITVVDSNEVTIERIPVPKYSTDSEQAVYQGNYNSVVINTDETSGAISSYALYGAGTSEQDATANWNFFYNNEYMATRTDAGEFPYQTDGWITYPKRFSTDGVSMKYKSTAHAVIRFNNNRLYNPVVLPAISRADQGIYGTVTPNYPPVSNTITINYKSSTQPIGALSGQRWFKLIGSNQFQGNLYLFTNGAWEEVESPVIDGTTLYSFAGNNYYLEKRSTNSYYTLITRDDITPFYKDDISSLFSASSTDATAFLVTELYRDNIVNRFGGDTDNAYSNNIWLPGGKTVPLTTNGVTIVWEQGDTFFQRYDHLKTYPFDEESKNNIVEIVSFMCETRVNADGRYDRNRGQKNNMSMTPQNFNLFNPVYSQKDNFFTYNYADLDLSALDNFPNSVTWTSEKTNGAITDAWTRVNMASILDIDGDKGEITSLNTLNNEIYCFQEQGLSNIIFNPRVQITPSDNVPIEISNSYKVQGKRYVSNTIGCNNKWSICTTPAGIYFVDNITNTLYLFNGQAIQPVSDKLGYRQFIGANSTLDNWNPVNFSNFRTFYDKTNSDVYFSNNNTSLCYSEFLQQFISFMSYEQIPAMFNYDDKFYSIKNNKLWQINGGDYNMFFDEFKPYSLTVVANQDGGIDKVFNTVEYRADMYDGDTFMPDATFNKLDVWNSYQHGQLTLTNKLGHPSPLKRKFRIWRANIPRANTEINGIPANNRDRIRNAWAYVKLTMDQENTYSMRFHDLSIGYYI